MQTVWLSPTDYVTGDPTLRITYASSAHPSTVIICYSPGDLKWVSMDLHLPPDVSIEDVTVCYQLSNADSFISQVRLTEMDTPDHALVIHDDGTDLKSTNPACYTSHVGGKLPAPGKAVTLALRLNFRNSLTDEIRLGAVGIRFNAHHGLSTANTGVENRVALSNAMAAAVASGKPLLIPAGTFDIDINDTQNTGAIPVNGSIFIRGAGRGQTVLRAVNYVAALGAAMFRVAGGAYDVTFSDLTLQGPPAGSMTVDNQVCWAIFVAGGGSVVRVSNVHTTLWNQAIKVSPDYPSYPGLGSRLYCFNCCFRYRVLGILHIEGTDRELEACHLEFCEFEADDAPPLARGPLSNGQNHSTYISRGVSFAVSNCKFIRTTGSGYGYLHYGGAGTPRYARCVNTYFASDVASAMLTASTGKTTITGCTFRTGTGNNGIRPQGDVYLSNCVFLGDSAGYGIIDDQSTEVDLEAVNCHFGSGGAGYIYSVRRLTGSTKVWRFIGCTFSDVSIGGAAILVDSGKVLLQSCVFNLTVGTYSLRLQGGTAVLDQCSTIGSKPMYVDTYTGPATLELWNNRWYSSATTEINSPRNSPIIIRGEGNRFYENSPKQGQGFALVGSQGISNLTGDLQCGHGLGNYSFSVSTLTVNWNYDTYSFNEPGQPIIEDINLAGSSSPGATDSDHNRFCSATIKLFVQQAFSLGAAGNIQAAPGVRNVGSVISLQYFPSLGKWVEI